MIVLTLPYPAIRWTSIVVAALVLVFNVFGLPYPGAYDNFLIVVSLGVNALTIWYAWRWVAELVVTLGVARGSRLTAPGRA
jgi:hypothetical protein